MLIGLTRPVEIRTVDLAGETLEDLRGRADAATPDGFELVCAPVRMTAGSTALTATATFHRRGGHREIEAEDDPALLRKVPDGSELLSVRGS